MLLNREFGTMEGTKYRNVPAVLETPEDATPKELASMPDHSIPNSTTESITFPSIPIDLYEAWARHPSESFVVFPPVSMNLAREATWDEERQALAPAMLVQEGESFYWDVIRCPYCSYWHRHSADNETLIPTTESNCKRLGPRESHCFEERRIVEAIGLSYWLIGIDKIPVPSELNRYFPMLSFEPHMSLESRANNVDKGQGGVYLIKSGDRYKIGKSLDPIKRIQSLSTACPYPVEIIHIEYTPNHSQLESRMHSQFARSRAHGEWFSFHPKHLAKVVGAMMGVNYGYH